MGIFDIFKKKENPSPSLSREQLEHLVKSKIEIECVIKQQNSSKFKGKLTKTDGLDYSFICHNGTDKSLYLITGILPDGFEIDGINSARIHYQNERYFIKADERLNLVLVPKGTDRYNELSLLIS